MAAVPDAITDRQNLVDLDEDGLRAFFAGIDEKPFRATQVLKWIHQQHTTDIHEMTNLSLALRERLSDITSISIPDIVLEQVAADKTRKWIVEIDRDNRVETVFIPEPGRGTLCVSSQVGCALDCSFCSTAQQGFNRNLSTAEIIGQLWLAVRRLAELKTQGEDAGQVTNVVFMGMGEPLLNFEPVINAINVMLNDNAYGLSRRRVTVSTAGVVPKIHKLREMSSASLAISLHATTDELRDKLVPINRKYPLAELMAACRSFVEDPQRDHITYEYVMLDNVNDTREDAQRLCRLLDRDTAKVNLIPFNPFPGAPYQRSAETAILTFQKIMQERGFVTTIRKTRGDDIDAACGQLVGKVDARGRRFRRRNENL